jgi:hypothetical protein
MAGAALSHDCGAASEMTAIRHARGSARSARPTGATRPLGRPTSYCPELAATSQSLQIARNRIQARKWLVSKIAPRRVEFCDTRPAEFLPSIKKGDLHQ